MDANRFLLGDCEQVLKELPEDSVDCVVTDPPYGYSFMGKDWDKAVPSVEVWKECLRVLKSGAFMFVMSSPRQDVLSQMIVRLGEAGFNMGFSSIYWVYASGFPKSENVSLQIDKRECMRQLVAKLGRKPIKDKAKGIDEFGDAWKTFRPSIGERHRNVIPYDDSNGWNQNDTSGDYQYTNAVTQEAKLLDGSYGGFQPKPAVECILVCMKPLSERTYVDQALKNGHGVTWLDNARIPFQSEDDRRKAQEIGFTDSGLSPEKGWHVHNMTRSKEDYNTSKGRFPANLLVSDDILNDGKEHGSTETESNYSNYDNRFENAQFAFGPEARTRNRIIGGMGSFSRYFDLDAWFSETFKKLPKEVQRTFPFLIVPKASKSERNEGLDRLQVKEVFRAGHGNQEEDDVSKRFRTEMKNHHPTVKPLALMSYLITLGSRLGDVILDPFVGSGTTCLAAKMLGRKWIGIDNNPEYLPIAEARLNSFQTLDSFSLVNQTTKEKNKP